MKEVAIEDVICVNEGSGSFRSIYEISFIDAELDAFPDETLMLVVFDITGFAFTFFVCRPSRFCFFTAVVFRLVTYVRRYCNHPWQKREPLPSLNPNISF